MVCKNNINNYKKRKFEKMKKRVLVVLLTIMCILPFLKVSAANMDSYIDWNLDRSIFAHQYRNGSDHVTNLAMITADGKVAYCIEPGITADKGSMYNSTEDINITNLKNVDVKILSLIGYYGYGYENHTTKEYYMATQELIWRLMGVENVWWSDSKEGGNIINIESYKDEILRLVNTYEISPKFNFKNKYIVGDEVTLEDLNNVLEGYEVTGNNSVKKDGNKITIKVKENDNNFTLRRKQNGKKAKFYYKNGYQTIGSFEYAYDYSKNYDIKQEYGKIIVNKIDKVTNSKVSSSKYASLKGAEYTLYDKKGNVIDVKKTDENGIATFNNLVKGTYVLKETKESLGYTRDLSRYETYVATSRLEATIDSYEKIIKNNVIIKKVLDDNKDGIMIPEENIEFGLYYDDGTLINTYVTDKDGIIELLLPYGKYVLKQLTKKDGIDVASDKVIEVINNNETQNITIINHRLEEEKIEENEEVIEELPNTGKTYNISYMILILSLGIIYYYEKKII